MRIVIGSYYRTGSTWLFNAARLSCIRAGKSITVHGSTDVIPYDTDVIIHKVHEHSPALEKSADLIFTSTRSLAEADASFLRAFGHPVPEEDRDRLLLAAAKWKRAARYSFSMNTIYSHPLHIIAPVAHCIAIEQASREFSLAVLNDIENLPPPSDKSQDPDTLYFTNHITQNGAHSSDSST